MSLFKPSNLTPNFESVVYNQPLTLTFQVNSNGSKVTACRVQIWKDINDDSDLEYSNALEMRDQKFIV